MDEVDETRRRRTAAEKQALQQERAEDAAAATAEYEAARLATLEKTARLRAQRLAKGEAKPPGGKSIQPRANARAARRSKLDI